MLNADMKKNGDSEYQDVRWQKRRLEILQAHNWTCHLCETKATDAMLHVHHLRYQRGTPVWETDNFNLTVLCKSCHERVTDLKTRLGANLHSRRVFEMMRAVANLIEDDIAGNGENLGPGTDALFCIRVTAETMANLVVIAGRGIVAEELLSETLNKDQNKH
jgi:hypothetical protein